MTHHAKMGRVRITTSRLRGCEKKQTASTYCQRWLDGLSATQTLIPKEIQILTIGDSEADIFDLFSLKRPENSDLLIRGTHNRKVDHCAKYLHLAIRQTEACGTVAVEVKRNPEHSARSANSTIRFATFDIQSEWQSLCATINKNPIPPDTPPSLRQAVRMIANLGGFLGRKGDGQPGVKTIWRGLRRYRVIAATWKLLHPDSPKTSL